MSNSLFQLLRLPSIALLRRRGGRRRVVAQINSRLSEIRSSRSHDNNDKQDVPDRTGLKIKRATALVRAGYVSRAARTLSHLDLPDVNDDVPRTLHDLHPSSTRPIPAVPRTAPLVAVDQHRLAELIRSRLKNGSSPGPSGWTGELVAPLVDDAECLSALALLVSDILNGNLSEQPRGLLFVDPSVQE